MWGGGSWLWSIIKWLYGSWNQNPVLTQHSAADWLHALQLLWLKQTLASLQKPWEWMVVTADRWTKAQPLMKTWWWEEPPSGSLITWRISWQGGFKPTTLTLVFLEDDSPSERDVWRLSKKKPKNSSSSLQLNKRTKAEELWVEMWKKEFQKCFRLVRRSRRFVERISWRSAHFQKSSTEDLSALMTGQTVRAHTGSKGHVASHLCPPQRDIPAPTLPVFELWGASLVSHFEEPLLLCWTFHPFTIRGRHGFSSLNRLLWAMKLQKRLPTQTRQRGAAIIRRSETWILPDERGDQRWKESEAAPWILNLLEQISWFQLILTVIRVNILKN